MNSQELSKTSSSGEGSVVSWEVSGENPGGRPLTPSDVEVLVLAASGKVG